MALGGWKGKERVDDSNEMFFCMIAKNDHGYVCMKDHTTFLDCKALQYCTCSGQHRTLCKASVLQNTSLSSGGVQIADADGKTKLEDCQLWLFQCSHAKCSMRGEVEDQDKRGFLVAKLIRIK